MTDLAWENDGARHEEEFRVVIEWPREGPESPMPTPFEQRADSLDQAHELARTPRAEYPRADVRIERRTVGPWVPVAGVGRAR